MPLPWPTRDPAAQWEPNGGIPNQWAPNGGVPARISLLDRDWLLIGSETVYIIGG